MRPPDGDTMTLEHRIAGLFRLDEQGWIRHANPWSFWTRIPLLALITLAIWSRAWIGVWSLVPIGLLALWAWVNPRAFPPPSSMERWVSKAVLGERLWAARDARPVPRHHRRAPVVLSLLALVGVPFLAFGLWKLEIWPVVVGLVLVHVFKLWFLDRMVWLFEDMHDPGY